MPSASHGRHLKVALPTLYPVDPSRVPGGVRSVTFNLLHGLLSYSDLEIHVLHCHSEVAQDREVREGNATLHFRAMPRQRIVPNTVAAVGKVQRMLQELDPGVANPHSAHYAVAALRAGLPTVYTVHGVAFREAPSYSHKGLAERLRFLMERYYSALAMRQVRHAVAISSYVMREYAGKTRAQWHRIDNPLPDEFFSLENREREVASVKIGCCS